MSGSEALVRKFGELTRSKTDEVAAKLGVAIDEQYLAKCFFIDWAMACIVAEDAGEAVEFYEDVAIKAERSSPDEMSVAFCLNACRGGFYQIENGDYAAALETFGLVRSVHGYLLRNDYRKIFSAIGKKGGESRNAPMNRVKARMIKTFQDGKKWRSVRQAAKSLEVEAKKAATEEGGALHYRRRAQSTLRVVFES